MFPSGPSGPSGSSGRSSSSGPCRTRPAAPPPPTPASAPPHEPPRAPAVQLVRLTSTAGTPSAKPQACQACQQRKRKCDRKRPRCSMCEKRNIDCVFDLKIIDSNPNLLTDMLAAMEEKDKRIAAIEALVRSHVPGLQHIASLPTVELAAYEQLAAMPAGIPAAPSSDLSATPTMFEHPLPLSDSSPEKAKSASPMTEKSSPASIPDRPDYGSQRLSPQVVAFVEDNLMALETVGTSGGARRPAVVTYISAQLGTNAPDEDAPGEIPSAAAWPPYTLAREVVDAFINTNALWPIFRRVELMRDIDDVYDHGRAVDIDSRATPLQTYNLFMMFSVACVWLAQRGSGNRVDTSLLRRRAMSCLSTVLRTESAVSCVSSLALLCLSAIYDWGGPDHVHLTPIVGKVAKSVELHQEPPSYLPLEEKDRRRTLFWCIYCMDIAVAGNLVNLGVSSYWKDKDIINTEFPTRLDTLGSLGEGYEPLGYFKSLIHMWDLTCQVAEYVKNEPSLEMTARLHGRMDEWYACTPRPKGGPTLVGDRSKESNSIFDLYYHLSVANIYRPRKLAQPSPQHICILKNSASAALRVSMAIQANNKLFDNYYQFNSVISLGFTLLCSLLLFEGDPSNALNPAWCTAAVNEITTVQAFIGSFCKGWPYARGMSRVFDSLAARIVSQISAASTASVGGAGGGKPVVPDVDLTSILSSTTDQLSLEQASTLASAYHLDGTWDTWINDSVVPMTSEGLGDVDMDTLLATIGRPPAAEYPDWLAAVVPQPQGH